MQRFIHHRVVSSAIGGDCHACRQRHVDGDEGQRELIAKRQAHVRSRRGNRRADLMLAPEQMHRNLVRELFASPSPALLRAAKRRFAIVRRVEGKRPPSIEARL